MPRILLAILFVGILYGQQAKVLVYTRNHVTNGKGYVHDNIATSVETIRELGAANGFAAEASDDPNVFTPSNLKQYRAIVFSNSNHEAFQNDSQRDAFRKFVQAGGGIVGIHIATGTERNWPYFWSLMGGKFLRHPKLQKFTVTVKDRNHPATKELPATFEWEDECYLFTNMNGNTKVLLTADPAGLDDPKRTEEPGELRDGVYALSWYNTFDGGRQYYTALGHKKEHYADPILRKQITGGILWAIGKIKD